MATSINQATIDGTKDYANRFKNANIPETGYRVLGRTHLISSTIGFGCYRIDDETSEHRESLLLALESGCNLIDTSTNYTDGGSERCVGSVVSEMIKNNKIKREEVVLVSKVGYAQGENLSLLLEAERKRSPFADVVKYTDGCWHCIHPDFIKNNLTRSLQRTGFTAIDVYLLHNPEYFFSDAEHRTPNASISDLRTEFYRRIRLAFEALEQEVAAGRISHYGVSSNTFGKALLDREMTSLSDMWDIAQSISPNHHFSVIQLPANLFEHGPMLEKNNNGETVLEFAAKKNLGVLINRPLNAIVDNQLIRLSDEGIRDATDSELSKTINHSIPLSMHKESLSRKAMAVLTNSTGVSVVLNGMRRKSYVDDSLGVMRLPSFELDATFFKNFNI